MGEVRIGMRQAEFDSEKEIKTNRKRFFSHINKRRKKVVCLTIYQILCFCFSQDVGSEYSGIAGF